MEFFVHALSWITLGAIITSMILFALQSVTVGNRLRYRIYAKRAYYIFVAAISASCATLMYFILSHNYRFDYVIRYTSSDLPLYYLISSFWAGQEGSFLLWAFLGAWLGILFLRSSKFNVDRSMIFYNLQLLFLSILLIKQSPFRISPYAMTDGFGLNILLQDPWMVIHPPVVFLGYAAFAVPYSIAMASLWDREYPVWIKRALKWIIFAFLTLGLGIILGGVWSYKVLGWGGYWGWDPVENASLLPWLVSIALIHGMIIQRKNGTLMRTNYCLVSISFLLVIYSTFLTRSGILADFSVHSFVDLGITGWLIIFMVTFCLISILLFMFRARELRAMSMKTGQLPLFSREYGLIAAVVLLVTSALAVGLGTSAPLLTRALKHSASVPTGYYAIVNFPIAILIAVFLSYVPLLKWGRNGVKSILEYLLAGMASGMFILNVVSIFWGLPPYRLLMQIMIMMLVFFSGFAIAVNLSTTIKAIRKKDMRLGGELVHLGVAVMFLSIILSTYYDRSRRVELPAGRQTDVLGYSMQFVAPEFVESSRGTRLYLHTKVERNGREFEAISDIFVEDVQNAQTNRFLRPHIQRGICDDLYISPEGFETAEDRYAMENTFVLHKNDSLVIDEYLIVFESFDLTRMNTGDTGMPVSVGAVLSVSHNNSASVRLIPYYQVGVEFNDERRIELPGGSSKFISLNGVDATHKSIELSFEDQAIMNSVGDEPPIMYAEVSIKPAMSILWSGIVLLIIGATIALIRHSRHKRMVPQDIRNDSDIKFA